MKKNKILALYIYHVTLSVPSLCLETQSVLPIPKWSNVLLTFTPVDLSYIYLLALSSSVLSIHWVEAVISGSWTRQIRCLDRAQHLSLLIGLRLYGIALEPTIKVHVLKGLIIKELKVLKNSQLIYCLILTCSFKVDFFFQINWIRNVFSMDKFWYKLVSGYN